MVRPPNATVDKKSDEKMTEKRAVCELKQIKTAWWQKSRPRPKKKAAENTETVQHNRLRYIKQARKEWLDLNKIPHYEICRANKYLLVTICYSAGLWGLVDTVIPETLLGIGCWDKSFGIGVCKWNKVLDWVLAWQWC